MAQKIKLTQGKYTIVDDADFEWLSSMRWFAYKSTHGLWYVARNNRHANNGEVYMEKMHRLVMGLTKGDGKFVDHINGDTLDNRRANLRVVSNIQNMWNKGAQSNNRSGYKGVYRHSQTGKWVAQITHQRKTYSLGCFDAPEEAHIAYKEKAIELKGVYARY